MKLHTVELDGKKIGFCDDTLFEVRIGDRHGHYKTKFEVRGNIAQAVHMYRCYNIGNGYRKQLRMAGKVIARYIS